jgi:hypothetical protein
MADDAGDGKLVDGHERGAHNRSPIGCKLTFQTTPRCASATKRSIKRFTCRDAGRYAAN